MVRVVDGAHRRALGDLTQRGRRRVLSLGQPVDPVVEEDDIQVHVAADAVHQVIAPDAQAVPVPGDHPDLQIGPHRFQPGGDRRGAAVNPVDPIGVHVVRESGWNSRSPRRTPSSRAGCPGWVASCHLGQDRVIAAARAPTHVLVTGKVRRGQYRQFCGCHGCSVLPMLLGNVLARGRKKLRGTTLAQT